MSDIKIQYQDKSGNWMTICMVQNISKNITDNMRRVQGQYRGARTRAVDKNDRIVDIL